MDWIENLAVVAYIFVIVFGVIYTIALIALLFKMMAKERGSSKKTPKTELSLGEQISEGKVRPYCYVNGPEVKAVYARCIGPVPEERHIKTASTTQSKLEVGGPVAKGSGQKEDSEKNALDFSAPLDDVLAQELMEELVRQDHVAFDLEASRPDQDRLNALMEATGRLAGIGASEILDGAKVEKLKAKLTAGQATSKDEKIKEVERACQKAFVGLRGEFVVGMEVGPIPTGGGTPSIEARANVLRLELPSSVVISAPFDMTMMKPHMISLLTPSRKVSNVMVFGSILDWNKDQAILTVTPLVIAPNWPLT